MTPFFTSDRGSIYKAYAQDVYPLITPGSVSLVISDGPYRMSKAAWDKFASWDAFIQWYEPHVEAWGRVCAEDATCYVWGSDESEGRLRALMWAKGWTFKGSVTWDKCGGQGARSDSPFPDYTEHCGIWVRGAPFVAHQLRTGHSPRGPSATTSIWRYSLRTLAPERLRSDRVTRSMNLAGTAPIEWAAPLHDCQKPLEFYRRMLLASCPAGGLTLECFAGTCRAAVACERLPAAEARRYVCIEPDEYGRDYLPAILPQLRYDPADDEVGLQRGLFA